MARLLGGARGGLERAHEERRGAGRADDGLVSLECAEAEEVGDHGLRQHVGRAVAEARLLVAATEAASFPAPVATTGLAAPPVSGGEGAARLASGSAGPSVPCVGTVSSSSSYSSSSSEDWRREPLVSAKVTAGWWWRGFSGSASGPPIHHSSSRGGCGAAERGARVGVRVDGGAE